MTKSRHVTFRCTQEQYARIKGAAENRHQTVSRFILFTLLLSVADTAWDYIEHEFPRKDKS